MKRTLRRLGQCRTAESGWRGKGWYYRFRREYCICAGTRQEDHKILHSDPTITILVPWTREDLLVYGFTDAAYPTGVIGLQNRSM
jgi:hypothetical protein